MNNRAVQTQSATTQLLHGHITNYRKTRSTQDFLLTQIDRNKMGATAIAAALAGLGGIAVGLSGMAIDTSDVADLLEFDLDGKHVRAWVWWSVFQEGDEVEVVAEKQGDVWIAYGIRRSRDEIVALYPHCSRGRVAHRRAVIKLWSKWGSVSISIPAIAVSMGVIFTSERVDWYGLLVVLSTGSVLAFAIYGVIAHNISKRLLGFVRLAEGIFTAFGWKDVRNIDLPAITKKNMLPGDPGALGVLYFRYPS